MYSLPSVSMTRQPTDCTKCVGPTASAEPYSPSTRLLPVDAPVGRTCAARPLQSIASDSSGADSGSAPSSSSCSAGAGGAAGADFLSEPKIFPKTMLKTTESGSWRRALDVADDFDEDGSQQ